MQYKIIDNFLPKDQFEVVKENMLGSNISWAYNSCIVKKDNFLIDNDPYNFQFTHTFYRNYQPSSEWISLLDPIINIINPSSLVRIKANLHPRTDQIKIHDYHYDHNFYDGKIAIFYVNTNNGYTIFSDETKIESIENRLLVFNGNMLHTGTTCTDQKVRCLINFMYYQWTDSKI